MRSTFNDLTLNNGMTATFVEVDFWSRPIYTIDYKDRTHRVCCTELNGTHLHTMVGPEEEPDSPLANDFQPTLGS